MKDLLKLLLVLLCGGIGAGIPLTCFYLLWHWSMVTLGTTAPYIGLTKVVVTIGLIATGGAVTVGLVILGGVLAGALAIAILEP